MELSSESLALGAENSAGLENSTFAGFSAGATPSSLVNVSSIWPSVVLSLFRSQILSPKILTKSSLKITSFFSNSSASEVNLSLFSRSEERRVGKECRSRRSPDH